MTIELLPVPVRNAIADALHVALNPHMEPSIAHIAPINTMGCFLLRHVTGIDYVPVAGSITVNAGVTRFGIVAQPDRLDEDHYYLWIEARYDNGAVEVVDFGARLWQAWAQEQGIIWTAPPPPGVLWDWKPAISADSVRFDEDAGITNAVREAIEHAVAELSENPALETWESVINDAIDRLIETEVGRDFLESRGIVESG